MTEKEAKILLDEFHLAHAKLINSGYRKHLPKELKIRNGYWYYKGFRMHDVSKLIK